MPIVVFICGLFSLSLSFSAQDCSSCSGLAQKIEQLRIEKRNANSELLKEKNSLKTLGPGKESNKMRVNAHLFVLTANIETAENLLLQNEKQYKQSCAGCKKLK